MKTHESKLKIMQVITRIKTVFLFAWAVATGILSVSGLVSWQVMTAAGLLIYGVMAALVVIASLLPVKEEGR